MAMEEFMRTSLIAAPLLLGAGLALSSPAHALSCLWGVHTSSIDQDAEVPSNAVLMVEHTYDAAHELALGLEDASGNAIPVRIESGHNHATIRPEIDLAPGDYRLFSEDEEEWLDSSFTVRADIDDEAPDAPRFIELDRQFDATDFGDSKGIFAELAAVDGAAWYEFEISEDADFADAHRVASVWPSAHLGLGLCLESFPEYRHRDRYHVRARAVDAAGNASAWTSSDGEVRGCSTVGAAPLLLGLPAGLLAFARRRRD